MRSPPEDRRPREGRQRQLTTPSVEDREVTKRLREVGELLGIELLDHVVVGRECYYSFADGRYHRIGGS